MLGGTSDPEIIFLVWGILARLTNKISDEILWNSSQLQNSYLRSHRTKNEVFIKDFFNKCDQIRRKSSMENFIFCVVSATKTEIATEIRLWTVIARFFCKLNIAFKFSFHQSIIHIEFVTCQLNHEISWHIAL